MGAFLILRRILILGIIIKIISKDYYVQTSNKKIYRCSLRGKFKKEISFKKDKLITFDLAVIGDKVKFVPSPDGTGVIEEIKEEIKRIFRSWFKTRTNHCS